MGFYASLSNMLGLSQFMNEIRSERKDHLPKPKRIVEMVKKYRYPKSHLLPSHKSWIYHISYNSDPTKGQTSRLLPNFSGISHHRHNHVDLENHRNIIETLDFGFPTFSIFSYHFCGEFPWIPSLTRREHPSHDARVPKGEPLPGLDGTHQAR